MIKRRNDRNVERLKRSTVKPTSQLPKIIEHLQGRQLMAHFKSLQFDKSWIYTILKRALYAPESCAKWVQSQAFL